MAETQNCKAKECSHEVVARGYCRKHYRLWKAGELPKPRYKTCTEEKCHKPRFLGSQCEAHYRAAHRKGAEAAAPAASEAAASETTAS
ncbi:MAG TPA: hypothetical protein VGI47_02870 [Candidatus Binataceae bacterium]